MADEIDFGAPCGRTWFANAATAARLRRFAGSLDAGRRAISAVMNSKTQYPD